MQRREGGSWGDVEEEGWGDEEGETGKAAGGGGVGGEERVESSESGGKGGTVGQATPGREERGA